MCINIYIYKCVCAYTCTYVLLSLQYIVVYSYVCVCVLMRTSFEEKRKTSKHYAKDYYGRISNSSIVGVDTTFHFSPCCLIISSCVIIHLCFNRHESSMKATKIATKQRLDDILEAFFKLATVFGTSTPKGGST